MKKNYFFRLSEDNYKFNQKRDLKIVNCLQAEYTLILISYHWLPLPEYEQLYLNYRHTYTLTHLKKMDADTKFIILLLEVCGQERMFKWIVNIKMTLC